MNCPDCAAKAAVIEDLRDCLRRLQTELIYVHAVEGDGHELCASGEGKACIEDAEEMLARTR